ncbi:MAG TPA: hypothetical protein VGI73_00570 [Solirubrobacterales bacterium]|jgi:hypothetical protein
MAGVALSALLLLIGPIASAAAAGSYDSEVEATTLSGSKVKTLELKTDVGTLKCSVSSFAGTQLGGFNESGDFSTEAVSVHPTFSGCSLVGTPGTVTTTGCNYEVSEPNELKASTSIVCEAGKAIIYQDVEACEIVISPQTPAGQVSLTNVGLGKTRTVNWLLGLTGIAYTYTASCPSAFGKGGSKTNGTVSGEETIKGLNALSEQVGIWVT